MTIDREKEDEIPFEACGSFIPGNPSRATTYRWAFKGVRGGIKLESFVCGNRRFTTRQAIDRFIAAQNADDGAVAAITHKQRQQQAEAANRLCAAKGY